MIRASAILAVALALSCLLALAAPPYLTDDLVLKDY